MATRYGHHPAVVGWQIDNEVGPPSFDPEAVAAWHAFLKTRYGTIDELNRRWTTEYWSQHYNDFDQVPLHATGQIGRAHVRTPVTNAHLVCRLLLEKKKGNLHCPINLIITISHIPIIAGDSF